MLFPKTTTLKLFLISSLLFSPKLLYAQQQAPDLYLKAISPVTPNAASLGQYGDIPVSMYTGVPDIQIPIYQIKLGDVNIPISLSYHGEGVKVEDYSSWVGTGWSLNAGGVINREQRGDPDENMIDNYSANQADFNNILNPSVSGPTKQTIANNHMSSSGAPIDMESDIFNYNCGGISGTFFMDATGKIYPVGANKIQIQQGGRISITNGLNGSAFQRWIITDNKGVKYYFGSNVINTVNTQEIVTSTASGSGSTQSVNSWFLTQIITPGKDTVNFNYQAYSYSTSMLTSSSKYAYPCITSFFTTSYLTYTQALRLTSITFPNGKIVFTAGGNRQELPGDQVLDHISIYEKHVDNNTYKLQKIYQLYNNNPANIPSNATPDQTFRLCLDSVTMFTSDAKRIGAYLMSYNNFNSLPPRTSTGQDLWGYYNGITSNLTLIPQYTIHNPDGSVYAIVGDANRAADSVYSTYGSLRSITYPTGGYSQFQFETNKAMIMNDSLLNFINTPTSTPASKQYTFKLSDNTGTTITQTSPSFTVGTVVPNSTWDFEGHVLPYGSDACTNEPFENSTEAYINPCFTAWLVGTQLNGTAVNYQIVFGPSNVPVEPGTYQIQIQYNAGSTGQAYVVANWQEEGTLQQSNEIFVGGLRIKSITNYDPVTGNTVVKSYKYTYSNNNRSSGTVENFPVFDYVSPVEIITNGSSPSYECPNVLIIASHSQSPLITTQGSIVGYANVVETVDNSGALGENIYTYTSDDDFVNDPSLYEDGGIGASIVFPFPETTNYGWKRGLLKQKETYANINNTLAHIGNTNSSYIFSSPTDVNNVYIPNIKFTKEVTGYTTFSGVLTLIYGNAYSIYYTTSGSVYNDTTREQLYDNVNYSNATTKTTTQLLDPQTLENASQSVINSDGKTIIKQFKYPLNYNITTATDTATQGLQNLINNNKVKEPVEILEISQDTSGNQTVTGGTILIYYNNKPEVKQVLELNVSQPIPIASFTQSSVNGSGNFIYDSRYEVRLSADKYSPKLQLAQETKVPGLHSTYIWDYNGEIPIATVSSADSTDVAYTSFEADGTGNWTIASALRDTTQGITGTRSYVLSNGNISKTGLTTTTTYVVSYWTKNTTPLTITGTQTGYPKQGPTINGWTYFEHEVKGRSTITLSGTGNIDEVRLYPSTAQMKTYTYDPLVGITSTADAKNQIEYYEYDTFQRLINIKDQYGNIVKHMSYHYQTLPY